MEGGTSHQLGPLRKNQQLPEWGIRQTARAMQAEISSRLGLQSRNTISTSGNISPWGAPHVNRGAPCTQTVGNTEVDEVHTSHRADPAAQTQHERPQWEGREGETTGQKIKKGARRRAGTQWGPKVGGPEAYWRGACTEHG